MGVPLLPDGFPLVVELAELELDPLPGGIKDVTPGLLEGIPPMAFLVGTLNHQQVGSPPRRAHQSRTQHLKAPLPGVINNRLCKDGEQQGTAIEVPQLAGGADESLHRREGDHGIDGWVSCRLIGQSGIGGQRARSGQILLSGFC